MLLQANTDFVDRQLRLINAMIEARMNRIIYGAGTESDSDEYLNRSYVSTMDHSSASHSIVSPIRFPNDFIHYENDS